MAKHSRAEVLKTMKEVGDKNAESKCYGNIGNVYLKLGYFKEASDYHNKALKMA